MAGLTNKQFVRLSWAAMVQGGGTSPSLHESNLRRMGRIVSRMRFQFGLNADDCRQWTSDMLGEPIDRADWDAVMYQIEGQLPSLMDEMPAGVRAQAASRIRQAKAKGGQ